MVRLAGHPRRPLRCSRGVPPPPHLRRRALPARAQGPPPPLRGVGRRHRPDVRHRPLHGPRARGARPQPRPRRPRPRQAPGHRRNRLRHPRRAHQDRAVRLLPRLHSSGGGGDGAAPAGSGGAGGGRAGEQRRRGDAARDVPARGRRRGVGEDDTGEPVGDDGGDGGRAARHGGAREGRRRQHRFRRGGGAALLPALLRLRRHQAGRVSVLQEPLRRVQGQRHRRAVPGPAVCGHQDGDQHGDAGGRPPVAADHADGGRVRRRGGALDRAPPPGLHAQPRPPAPVVPLPLGAGPRARRAPAPREPPAAGRLPAVQVAIRREHGRTSLVSGGLTRHQSLLLEVLPHKFPDLVFIM